MRSVPNERSVYIQRAGVVSPLGHSPEELSDALFSGKSGISAKIYQGAQTPIAPCSEPENIGDFEGELRIAPRTGRLALLSARQAFAAHESDARLDRSKAGVFFGMGSAPVDVVCQSFLTLQERGRVEPFALLKGLPNIAASLIAIDLGFKGQCNAFSLACASGLGAIGRAFHEIRYGRLDLAIAGGVDCPLDDSTMAAWRAMRVVASGADDASKASRPFDKDRRGIVLGEGSIAFAIGNGDYAAKDARLAEIVGYAESCDASHLTKPSLEGQFLCMKRALTSAGLEPKDVDLVVSHGTATSTGDLVESSSIQSIFGAVKPAIPVISNKGMIGHTLGASGAFNVFSAIMALNDGKIHGTYPSSHIDEQVQSKILLESTKKDIQFALINSFAFGGINVSLILKSVS